VSACDMLHVVVEVCRRMHHSHDSLHIIRCCVFARAASVASAAVSPPSPTFCTFSYGVLPIKGT